MASKSKKAQASAAATSTTIELVSSPSTGSQSSQHSIPSTPSRPMSPTRLSRIQERAELQNLNDRLAAYIERNRQLESENKNLKVQVKKTIESREIHSVKKMYESELGETRKSLDNIALEKAQLELANSREQENAKKIEAKLNKRNVEFVTLEKKFNSQESQLEDLRNRINQGVVDRKKLEGDNKNLSDEIKSLDDRLDSLKKQLEEETILRVDLENRNQSLNEELQFQRQLYQKELEEVRLKEYEYKEVIQENIKEQYEQKLKDELKELREDTDAKIAAYRQDFEDRYEGQLAAAQDEIERKNAAYQSAQTKIKQLNSTYTFLSSEVQDLKRDNDHLKEKVQDLNKLIEQERDWSKISLDRKEEEVAELRNRLDALMEEHKDLIDDKIRLDNELAVYRKLLEGEETRLNMSPNVSSTQSSLFTQAASAPSTSATATSGSYTPRAYISRGNKRKRICLQEEENLTDIHVDSNTKGDIEISDHDQDGKFVKLHNKGEKEASLSGWQLLRTADGLETRYKFHRTVAIKPGQTITVWSSDANAIHQPPNDIVMKAQTWFTADKMATTLFNNNTEEVASRVTEKRITSHLSRLSSQGYLDENETDEQQKCLIM